LRDQFLTPAKLTDISKLIGELNDDFGFTWEEFDFTQGIGDVLVYWPVRLRPPTPIHAVQSFVAAALQKAGATVVLCVDDLGNIDGENDFYFRVQQWFGAVGGDATRLKNDRLLFSEVLSKEQANDTWCLVQTWLGETKWHLDNVLKVSKLLDTSVSSLDQLLQKRPRRLLTPALVWTCLLHIYQQRPKMRILTLGGNDERPLWEAWRELAKISTASVGHLYAPELREAQQDGTRSTLHMSTRDIGWSARQDIEKTLLQDLESSGAADGLGAPISLSRLFGWCLNGCVCLPTFSNGGKCNLSINGQPTTCNDLNNIDHRTLAKVASGWINEWVL
jgi:hypothetical protein